MIGLKNSYEIAYNGTENECRFELYADTAAEMVGVTHYDGIKIQMGSECTDIATGDKYILNGSGVWVLQPSANAFSNVYTKTEIDAMIANYYTKTESDALFEWITVTITTDTLPLSFISNGFPLTVWSISGNGQQNGTPSPQNILPFDGTGERTGNILPSAAEQTLTSDGITIRCDGNGRYYISGTASSTSIVTFSIPDFVIPISSGRGGNGTFSLFNTEASSNAYLQLQLNGAKIDDWNLSSINRASTGYVSMGGKTMNQLAFRFPTGTSYDGIVSPMFTDNGILPAEFEPFGWAEKITCAGQTTPLYLGEVSTVRRVKKYVLTGEENWQIYTSAPNTYRVSISNTPSIGNPAMCSHFVNSPIAQIASGEFTVGSTWIYIRYADVADLADFKSYLAAQYAAGTPVTVWYVLAKPETAVVNEPLCKIGDYADTLTSTTPIPTAKGNNTLSVDTSVQPSEISITGGIRNE